MSYPKRVRRTMRLWVESLILAVSVVLAAAPAWSYPALQLFIEGAEYDPDTESWVTTAPQFNLWVIGDVGRVGAIYEVKLAMAFFGTGTVALEPIASALTCGLIPCDPSISSIPDADPGTPGIQAWSTSSDPGNSPYENPPLPPHGIYTEDSGITGWANYFLGT